jgi:hypothetical protein
MTCDYSNEYININASYKSWMFFFVVV